jgi:hypothetical protein
MNDDQLKRHTCSFSDREPQTSVSIGMMTCRISSVGGRPSRAKPPGQVYRQSLSASRQAIHQTYAKLAWLNLQVETNEILL